MKRLSLSATVLAAAAMLAPISASAQGMEMSAEDRAAFRAEIRAYLLDNPEVIFEAVAEYERRNAAAQADMDTTLVEINADEIFNDSHSWVGGNPDGDLTIVEFMDYRCGFCARALPELANFVGSDGNIRLVIKEFPILGPQSDVMSRYAVALLQVAGADAYDAAHARLMGWDGDFTETSARLLSDELGVDGDAVIAHMSSDDVREVLRANRELAQRLQISGTPTFVLGADGAGEMLRGYLTSDEMAAVAARMRNAE